MKHLFLTSLAIALGLSGYAGDKPSETVTNDDVILHAWCWSFNTIKENMKQIADAGYRYVDYGDLSATGDDGYGGETESVDVTANEFYLGARYTF